MLRFDILTVFPEMFDSPLSSGVVGKALKNKIIDVQCLDLRRFTSDQHKSVDDYPFGGGGGMILKPEPIFGAVDHLTQNSDLKPSDSIILLSPQGRKLDQKKAEDLAKHDRMVLICGRYDGVDERVVKHLVTEEVSIGDYVLAGGEIAAQVLLEGCIRLIPGVLGHPKSLLEESFSNNLLEYPQFTRPQVWEDSLGKKHDVPEVLISGHHNNIKKWRLDKSVEKTKKIRPDLFIKKEEEQD